MNKVVRFAIPALLTTALLAACSAKQTNTYVIQGDVSGVTETGIAKLTQMTFDGEKRQRVDVASTEIADGKFVISGEIEEPALMRLYVEVEDKPVDRADVIVEPGAEIDVLYFGEIPGIWADGTGTHKTLISGYRFSADYVAALDEYTSIMLQRRAWSSRLEDEDESGDEEEQVSDDATSSEEPAGPVDASESGISETVVAEASTGEAESVEGEELVEVEIPEVEFDEEDVAAELERLSDLASKAYVKLDEAKQAFLDPFAEQDDDPAIALLALEAGALGRTQKKIDRLAQLAQVLPASATESRIDPLMDAIRNHLLRVEVNEALVVGEAVQDFTLASLDGNEHNLFSTLAENDYVLVDFWASWCGPCIAQFPDLKEVYAKHSPSGFEVVNVSLDDNREDWEKASAEQELPWIDVGDMQAFDSETAKAYGVTFIPKGYLVGADGVIVAKDMNMEELDQYLVENFGSPETEDEPSDQVTGDVTGDTQAIGS